MTKKDDLQQELKEKVKEGVKPSDLKKLKHSKSADDILDIPPLPNSVSLNRSKSAEPQSFSDPKYPYTTLISQSQELEKLRKESEAKSTTISLLRKKIEELENSLSSLSKERQELEKSNPPNLLLQEQLAEKQKQIEELRAKLEEKNTSAETSTELDNSLFARHRSLKDWFTQYQKTKKLDKELAENVNEASQELLNQDEKISSLRTELSTLKRQKQSLSRDLELVQRAVAWRKRPYLPENPPYPFLEIIFYTLISVGFLCWLFKPQ